MSEGVGTMKKIRKSEGASATKRIALRLAPVLIAGSLVIMAVITSRDRGAQGKTLEQRATPDAVIHIGPEVLNALREVAFLEVLLMETSQRLERHLEDHFIILRLGNIHIESIHEFQVTAGINLSKVTARQIRIDRQGDGIRVTVTVPWPIITGIRCLEHNYEVAESRFFRRSNVLIHITLADMDTRARNLVEERCMRMGIVEEAAVNARIEIEALLKRVGADVVVVRFE